jgi:hypothetical protein
MRNPLKSRPRNARLAVTGAAVAAMIAIPSAVAAASGSDSAYLASYSLRVMKNDRVIDCQAK